MGRRTTLDYARMLRIALAVLVALASTASAKTRVTVPDNLAYIRSHPELYPAGTRTIELITMGVGGLIWERHGHIALCVVYSGVPREADREDCYNSGVGDFQHAVKMGWGFLRGVVDFVINIPREYDQFGRPDGYLIRRQAVDSGVSLVTDLQLARAIVEALRWRNPSTLEVLALDDYVAHGSPIA